MKQIRVLYQVFFLALFLLLLVAMDVSYLRGYPVRWFLQLDPLLALAAALSTHALYHGLLWSLLTIALTVLFGRVFCGWFCPLGTLHQAAGAWFDARTTKEKLDANRPRPLYALKYYILIALLVMAAGHSLQVGWLDPIPFVTRGFAVFVQPASQTLGGAPGWLGLLIAVAVAGALGWGISWWLRAGRPGAKSRRRRDALRDGLLAAAVVGALLVLLRFSPVGARRFHWGFWIAALVVLTLALNRAIPRFWCRALCPLGALLGLVSKFSLWQIHRAPETCTGCGRCVADCQGACEPDGQLRKSECLMCLNCRDVCPERSIAYGLMPPVERERRPSPDLDRRRIVGAAALGLLWIAGVRVGGVNERRRLPGLVRPPGSAPEREFLERCVKCGACMKVCPTNVIQPAMAEAGVEGLWTPVMALKVGACELDCTLCGQVCPTGAIRPFTRDEKLGRSAFEGRPIRIGTAFIDRGRCLPWAMDKPCVVCQEVCPVSPKAIITRAPESSSSSSALADLAQPWVIPDRCIGCGICEKECPVHDLSAIRVTSVGESRSLDNRMLLRL